jgi:hypothetical protein
LRSDGPVLLTEITCRPSLGIEVHDAGSSSSRTRGASPGSLAKSGLEASEMTLV